VALGRGRIAPCLDPVAEVSGDPALTVVRWPIVTIDEFLSLYGLMTSKIDGAQPPTYERPDWHRRASCRGADPGLFFVDAGQSSQPAKALCCRCPVQSECLDYAMRYPALTGVWGGVGIVERKQMRRQAS